MNDTADQNTPYYRLDPEDPRYYRFGRTLESVLLNVHRPLGGTPLRLLVGGGVTTLARRSLQPIGDLSYDPSCFRLVRTSGQLIVSRSGGNPDTIIDFEDQLYFENIPDNTGLWQKLQGPLYPTTGATGARARSGAAMAS